MDATELAFHTQENSKDIHALKMVIFGDGNGQKGLIRRVDALEIDLKFIKKQNWVIIAMLLGLYAELVKSLLVP